MITFEKDVEKVTAGSACFTLLTNIKFFLAG